MYVWSEEIEFGIATLIVIGLRKLKMQLKERMIKGFDCLIGKK